LKEKYKGKLEVKIHTTDSEQAKGYEFKSATNVLFDKEWIPIDVATNVVKMETFLSDKRL